MDIKFDDVLELKGQNRLSSLKIEELTATGATLFAVPEIVRRNMPTGDPRFELLPPLESIQIDNILKRLQQVLVAA